LRGRGSSRPDRLSRERAERWSGIGTALPPPALAARMTRTRAKIPECPWRPHRGLWDHPHSSPAYKKRLLRLAVREIIATCEGDTIRLVVHWQGGRSHAGGVPDVGSGNSGHLFPEPTASSPSPCTFASVSSGVFQTRLPRTQTPRPDVQQSGIGRFWLESAFSVSVRPSSACPLFFMLTDILAAILVYGR
jgi:hypothetical protein